MQSQSLQSQSTKCSSPSLLLKTELNKLHFHLWEAYHWLAVRFGTQSPEIAPFTPLSQLGPPFSFPGGGWTSWGIKNWLSPGSALWLQGPTLGSFRPGVSGLGFSKGFFYQHAIQVFKVKWQYHPPMCVFIVHQPCAGSLRWGCARWCCLSFLGTLRLFL